MAIQCDQSDIYHNLSAGSNGTTLLYQTLYMSSSGGPVMDGIYCDGTYIYTVSGGSGVVSNVETVASQGCGNSPTPIPTQTSTPIPWICVQLVINVSPVDRLASDDGYVYFDFYDCNGTHQTLSYNTNKTNFNTGFCLTTEYSYSCYIFVDSVQTTPTASGINDPFTATICVP